MAERYVTQFLNYFRSREYEKASDLLLNHGDDLVARLTGEDVGEIFTEFVLSDMVSEARTLYQIAVRLGKQDLVDVMEGEMTLLDLGASKRRMIAKRSNLN